MPDNLKVICTRCEADLTHECQRWRGEGEDGKTTWMDRVHERHHANPLVHAFIELLLWRPEGGLPAVVVSAMKESSWYEDGDEDAPFFSQSVIYPLLNDKDGGRSFFSLLHGWMRAAGFNPWEIQQQANRIRAARDAQRAQGSGGLVPTEEVEAIDLRPEVGWTVGLTAEGVGEVPVTIVGIETRTPSRGGWDMWIVFGKGRCSFRRLLRVAHWINDEKGERVWPPPKGG